MGGLMGGVTTADGPPLYAAAEREDGTADLEGGLATVARYTEVWEAHILRARLEAEGVIAIVADQHLIGANWFYSNALGGVRVQVPVSQLDTARQVLSALERGDYALAEEPAETPPALACPRCGGADIEPHTAARKLAFISLWLLQIPLPFSRWKNRCRDCGWRWREPLPEATPEASA